jgi:hypothetical protein
LDAAQTTATIAWPGQTDALVFTTTPGSERTGLSVQRGKTRILSIPSS